MKKWTILSICSVYLWTAARCKGSSVGQSCTTQSGIPGTVETLSSCPSLRSSFGERKTSPIICCPRETFTRSTSPRRNKNRRSGTKNRDATSIPNLRFVGCGEGGPSNLQRRVRSIYADEEETETDYYYDGSDEQGSANASDDEYDYRNHFNITTSMIVGGNTAVPHTWQWMAGLAERRGLSGSRIFCGASIITTNFLMSAAHCVKMGRRVRTDFFALLGGHTTRDGISYPVQRTYVHPKYRGFSNDISLIQLRNAVVFTTHIKPICLPSVSMATSSFQGKQAMATGWGTISEGGAQSTSLRQVVLTVIPTERCTRSYRRVYPRSPITSTQLCANGPGKDTCQGDSGGPLVLADEHGKWTQIGITSFGYGCAHSNYPGVYTRVGAFLPWMKTVIG